jgi:hypothetical protein
MGAAVGSVSSPDDGPRRAYGRPSITATGWAPSGTFIDSGLPVPVIDSGIPQDDRLTALLSCLRGRSRQYPWPFVIRGTLIGDGPRVFSR